MCPNGIGWMNVLCCDSVIDCDGISVKGEPTCNALNDSIQNGQIVKTAVLKQDSMCEARITVHIDLQGNASHRVEFSVCSKETLCAVDLVPTIEDGGVVTFDPIDLSKQLIENVLVVATQHR